jgi:hypothetical protein
MSESNLTPPSDSRPIPSAPGYRIKDGGEVWSCKRDGRWKALRGAKASSQQGHVSICLVVGGKKAYLWIHRLVLEAFVGPCPLGLEACHCDGNPSNNFISNLRWDTHYNNQEDRRQHGTLPIGEQHGNAKLTEDDIREIFRLFRQGISRREISKIIGSDYTNVCLILQRKAWAHVDIDKPSRADTPVPTT